MGIAREGGERAGEGGGGGDDWRRIDTERDPSEHRSGLRTPPRCSMWIDRRWGPVREPTLLGHGTAIASSPVTGRNNGLAVHSIQRDELSNPRYRYFTDALRPGGV